MGRVAVVGSANVDHVIRVPHLPAPGETVLGSYYAQYMGGKGANQAVAAARLGASAHFIGAFGTDAAGDEALRSLETEGVDCRGVARVAEAASGAAVIAVDGQGENQIAVAPGANLLLDPGDVTSAVEALQPSVVLAVLEVPMAAVLAAAEAGRACDAWVLINSAPAQPLPDAVLANYPLIILNADELPLVGPSAGDLLKRGAEGVIVTRGPEGAGLITADGEVSISAERAGTVIDATGEGDTFSGALAALLAEGLDLSRAARMANTAAGLSVLREGARSGMPTRLELEERLERSPSV
jgi:ribokinase